MSTLQAPLPRDESELGRNRAAKGDQSYYYAHTEGWQVPVHAVVRSGPGLVTGGKPVPLGPDGQPLEEAALSAYPLRSAGDADDASSEVIAQLRARVDALERELMQARGSGGSLSQFSFSDEGAKCKVYVEVGSGVLERKVDPDGGTGYAEAGVAVAFTAKRCVVCVTVPSHAPGGAALDRRSAAFSLEAEIVPEKCNYKVDRTKGRITLTLKKQNEEKKWRGPQVQAA